MLYKWLCYIYEDEFNERSFYVFLFEKIKNQYLHLYNICIDCKETIFAFIEYKALQMICIKGIDVSKI